MQERSGTGRRVSPADVERIIPFGALLDRIADEHVSEWISFRRLLHANPEPSGQEWETTKLIERRLSELRISSRIPERGVGVIADLSIGSPPGDSPLIAIRADIDALRMQDRKKVAYASACPGVAHACGHDAHTAVAVAAAHMMTELSRRISEETALSARLRFIFQPAEETAEGAAWMVEDGALDGVSSILGLHVDPTISAGRVGIRYGVLTAQVDELVIQINGRGGHAARPQHTTDPIGTAAMLVSSLYQTVPRKADSLHPTVMTIGSIHSGTASNVIPDYVEICGTLRSTDRKNRAMVMETIKKICAGLGAATGNTITAEFHSPLGSVINDVTVMSACEASAVQSLGDSSIVLIDKPSMGGEDFAVYLDHVRGAQFRLGCARTGEDWPLLHSPHFDIDESAIPLGARILTGAALLLAQMTHE